MTFIFGAGGNAKSIANIMVDLGIEVSGFVLDEPKNDNFIGFKVLSYQQFIKLGKPASCVISIGQNSLRRDIQERILLDSLSDLSFPTFIHPTAYVSTKAKIGQGAIVFPNVSIGPDSVVEDFVQLNTNSIVEHDSRIGEFASLAPGAVVGGSAVIGCESAVLMNATVSNRTELGRCVVLGANSFIKSSTGNNEIWVGSPAKLLRSRDRRESYF